MQAAWTRTFGVACALGMTVGAASPAEAFVTRTTAAGKPVRWTTDTVSFSVDPALEAAVPGATSALEAAMAAWASPNAPALSASLGSASVRPAVDGKNVVYYAPHGYPGAGDALAITLVSFDEDSGAVVDCDIVVNGAYRFAVLPDDARAGAGAPAMSMEGGGDGASEGAVFDIAHVLSHESGHVLSLRDEPDDTAAVMYPFTFPGDASRRAPAADDLAGVAAVYPAGSVESAPEGGCGGARIAPQAPAPWWSVGLVLAALTRAIGGRRRAGSRSSAGSRSRS